VRPHLRHSFRLTLRPDGTQPGQLVLTFRPYEEPTVRISLPPPEGRLSERVPLGQPATGRTPTKIMRLHAQTARNASGCWEEIGRSARLSGSISAGVVYRSRRGSGRSRCRVQLGSRRDRKDRVQRRRYSTGVSIGVGAQGFRVVSSTCGKSEALSGLPHTPMIMRHGGVGWAEMGEGVVDRIGKGRDAADVRRLADSLGAECRRYKAVCRRRSLPSRLRRRAEEGRSRAGRRRRSAVRRHSQCVLPPRISRGAFSSTTTHSAPFSFAETAAARAALPAPTGTRILTRPSSLIHSHVRRGRAGLGSALEG
jgi:hypothetical protein